MRMIRLGVVFDQDFQTGGGFHQSVNAALLAKKLESEFCKVFFYTFNTSTSIYLQNYGIPSIALPNRKFSRIKDIIRRFLLLSFVGARISRYLPLSDFEKRMVKDGIDLVYFLSPNARAMDLVQTNYVMTVWDLCHRDMPEFPEVRVNGEFENREYFYSKVLPKAIAVIADSSIGKENIARRYQIDKERIFILPFESLQAVQWNLEDSDAILAKYEIKRPYLFYPAQFWPHKNHVFILKAMKELVLNDRIEIEVVFVGSDKGNLDYVKKTAERLGVSHLVHFLGYVSDEEIVLLYKKAFALVMTSYFGPTNMPPLEAFHTGTPVLHIDLPYHRDYLGDAVLYFDADNPRSLADACVRLLKDKDIRDQYIAKGYKYIYELNQYDRTLELKKIISNYGVKRDCWL